MRPVDRVSAALALLLVIMSHASAADCSNETAIWQAEEDGGKRYLLTTVAGPSLGSWRARIEQWRDSQRTWHIEADIFCSMGAVICRIEAPNMLASDEPEKNLTTAVVERIDADSDGVSDWIVFAALSEQLWYAGGAKVEWADGIVPDERIQIPNAFRLFECRLRDQDQADPNGRADGPIFAIPSVCRSFEKNGSLTPAGTSDPFPDGLWWMDNKKMVGWEFECQVKSWNADRTVSFECSGLEETWTETRTVREILKTRFVDDVPLSWCSAQN